MLLRCYILARYLHSTWMSVQLTYPTQLHTLLSYTSSLLVPRTISLEVITFVKHKHFPVKCHKTSRLTTLALQNSRPLFDKCGHISHAQSRNGRAESISQIVTWDERDDYSWRAMVLVTKPSDLPCSSLDEYKTLSVGASY